MVPPVNSRTSITSPIYYCTKGIVACQVNEISSQLHMRKEDDGAGGDVKNAVWRKVLQNKSVVGDLESSASVAKEKFPNFAIEGKSNEICDATKQLLECYKKHSKHLPSTEKFHHITIENKVVGYFLTKTCRCHHQIKQNQEKVKSDAVAQAFPLQYIVNSIKLDAAFYVEKVGKLFRFYPQCALKVTLRNISLHS